VSLSYKEGDWFAVPLSGKGFSVGLVARANGRGVLLGYFFGPRRSELPNVADLVELSPIDAVLVGQFGHLGLKQERWPVLGALDGWERERWPMPSFIRRDILTGRSWRMLYDDDDPNLFLREEPVRPGEDENLPEDGLMGAEFTELRLSRLLEV
jgi:hypothetical protein